MSKQYYIDRLKEIYPDHTAKECADMLGICVNYVYSLAHTNGIKKSEAFLKSPKSGRTDGTRGMTGRFQKGHTSWNKGKRTESIGNMVKTQYKSGHLPHNTKFDGAESVRFNKKEGKQRVWVRVDMGKWIEKSKLVWKEAFGELPAGMVIAFKDGNQLNVVPENLELITRQELMKRNTIQRYSPELKQLIRLNSKLKNTIKKYGKEQAE